MKAEVILDIPVKMAGATAQEFMPCPHLIISGGSGYACRMFDMEIEDVSVPQDGCLKGHKVCLHKI